MVLDSLTGLYNQRFADERLPLEMAHAEQQSYPLTVVMFDLDGLKRINDLHGRPAGDEVLKQFSRALKRSFRKADLLARMGGDNFIAVLPGCGSGSVPNAMARIGCIEVNVAGLKVAVSFSAGWAECRRGESVEDLLRRVELALQADKGTRKTDEQNSAGRAKMRQVEKIDLG